MLETLGSSMHVLSKDVSPEGSKVLEKSSRKTEHTQSGTLVTDGDWVQYLPITAEN